MFDIMPPKTRGTKTSKVLKENVEVIGKTKINASTNGKRAPRKALSDKTNSASDDNATLPSKKPTIKTDNNIEPQDISPEKLKKHRVRRVPARFIGNPVLANLSNSYNDTSPKHDSTPIKMSILKKKAQVKLVKLSPHKKKQLESSILKPRPKRICRLPSKLEGHSVSPNKYIPLQPVHASTPIANKGVKVVGKVSKDDISEISPARSTKKKPKTLQSNKNKDKLGADTNNNGKKQLKINKCFEKQLQSGNNIKSRNIVTTNSSFRVLDGIKNSLKRDSSKLDPYEFTFDPEDEPTPQKKKKKRAIKKSQAKPKTVVRGIYEKNLAKALASLKNTVQVTKTDKEGQITEASKINIEKNPNPKENITAISVINVNKIVTCENNFNSVRVEDIALDFQGLDEGDNINYSPVNSPHRDTPQVVIHEQSQNEIKVNDKDSLNLQGELSFFDDQPVASSSMNMSTRHPLASPWRVEFGSLPIKWQANTYVKPNMTPAVESSFINASDLKKRHVYTNIVSNVNESLLEIVNQPTIKQTSIISFMEEVVERSVNKKKKISTPVKANSLFEDTVHTPRKSIFSKENCMSDQSKASSNTDKSVETINDEENVNQTMFTPNKNKGTPKKRHTCFGFDDSVEQNQENVSPLKKDKRSKTLRPRSHAVLREINNLKGPSRAVIPVSVKSLLNSDNLNKNYEDPKSGMEPPVFTDKVSTRTNQVTVDSGNALENDELQSVHLFEDIDFINHYQQPSRKSYGKAKKVAFRQNSASDSDVAPSVIGEQGSSEEEDNLDDLSFKLPTVKSKRTVKKKITKKQKLTKKEEKEAETWAAGFNSMCEDVEGFDLIVE